MTPCTATNRPLNNPTNKRFNNQQMADIHRLGAFIRRFEGGFANDQDDPGGPTMRGVTIATYEHYCRLLGYPRPTVERLRGISDEEWWDILRTLYWDRWQADHIVNQSIAELLVDWVWASGWPGVRIPQRLLGVRVDGRVGPETLRAVNTYTPQRELFDRIMRAREEFIDEVCRRRPRSMKYRRGWLRRLHSITFEEQAQ